ncbi:MAG: PIN domain-containing protein [Opitutaceae bacterium]|jgi:tRNA(fMet)-specific endonuclease VapC|nr:PIN domain-containing protein [Opitutaceae bacterium]
MNGILIDTTLLVAYERGRFDLTAFFKAHPDTPFAMSAVTVSELWHGVERADAARKKVRTAAVETLLDIIEILDFTEDIAREHAHIWATLEKAGERIGAHDMMIAATATTYGYALATFNTKEFKRVPGLSILF